ncbi:MAG: isocitrate/isopropylmalate dehydrogenase family protein, partial [Nitrososphaerales archaeon]
MGKRKVALIKGDGTGPELVDSMLKVVDSVGVDLEFIPCEAGLEWWENNGGPTFIPDSTWQKLENSDACFKGPTTTLPKPGTPRSVVVSIRQKFDLYANVRPIKSFQNNTGPLGEVDFVCVRENTEGMYSGLEHRLSDDLAITIRKITRKSSERIARFSFEMAKNRGWDKVVGLHKGNILKESDGLFLEAIRSVAETYTGISLEEYFIDNFGQQLVKNPDRFNQNIIFGTNLFMDLMSEVASALVGSIGTIPSSNIGERYALFEPAHGSAPKYVGLNKVNPTATILAAAHMLEYLGYSSQAQSIFRANEQVIAEKKVVTYDLGGSAGTSEMAEAIA